MKRVIVKAFAAHSLTLTVEASRFLLAQLEERVDSLQSPDVEPQQQQEDAIAFLNQLLASSDKSKCMCPSNRHLSIRNGDFAM